MRRREKFIIIALLLSLGLFVTAYIPLEFRYLAIGGLMILSFLLSALALKDDLNAHEWITILPFPSLYAGSVAFFYFLLPGDFFSKIFIMLVFGLGMYSLFLTSNIYSVAKGRTIQLLYAAHAVGLLLTLITSLLFTNTILSFHFSFWLNGLLVGLIHFPLIYMALWSVRLEEKISTDLLCYSSLLSIAFIELVMLMSLVPIPIWNASLFIMGLLYISLGVLQSFLKGRLFSNTTNEYLLVAIFLGILFLVLFPGK